MARTKSTTIKSANTKPIKKIEPMVRTEKTAITTPGNDQVGKKVCTCCENEKDIKDFYISYGEMFKLDMRAPICKKCVISNCLNKDGTINIHSLKRILFQIDKPLYYDDLEASLKNVAKKNPALSSYQVKKMGDKILQKYFLLSAARQNREKTFKDSEHDGFIHQEKRTNEEARKILEKYVALEKRDKDTFTFHDEISEEIESKDGVILDDGTTFKVTQEMIDLFGDGYTPSLYKKMFEKYEKLKINYTLQTNIHQEALATYVRFKVQEEIETARGNVSEAKKWYDAAQSAAQDAKLTPKQLTKADLDGGLNSISEIAKAVEQAVDVIKILPRFKYRPNDAPDFTIWCYINYERQLNDQPPVSYEDVYKFYDKRREEYIAQNGDPYGIFENDPTVLNRKNVETFITLPNDYDEYAGDTDD